MSDIFAMDRTGSAERVLLVASAATPVDALRGEIALRGAALLATDDIALSAEAARRRRFDAILIVAREDAQATALVATLLRAEGQGAPRLLLLVDPAAAHRYGQAIIAADEVMALSLNPKRICDTAGIGLATGYPRAAAFG